jgi:adenylate kinase
MLNIILFGPPGSGKGTQALQLKSKYGLAHLSTGDIFRAQIASQSELGAELKNYLDSGRLVPDDLTFRILVNYMESETVINSSGIIFDGFPRTLQQAEMLDETLNNRKEPINIVLSLIAREDEVVNRILLRGQTSGRSDDNDESIIRKRMQVYRDQTLPLASYYLQQGKYIELDGEGTIENVFGLLCTEIDKVKSASE